jgi:hypothetical protein
MRPDAAPSCECNEENDTFTAIGCSCGGFECAPCNASLDVSCRDGLHGVETPPWRAVSDRSRSTLQNARGPRLGPPTQAHPKAGAWTGGRGTTRRVRGGGQGSTHTHTTQAAVHDQGPRGTPHGPTHGPPPQQSMCKGHTECRGGTHMHIRTTRHLKMAPFDPQLKSTPTMYRRAHKQVPYHIG